MSNASINDATARDLIAAINRLADAIQATRSESYLDTILEGLARIPEDDEPGDAVVPAVTED